jgi:predicted metal-dependent phosphoesterase TrpH
MLADLHTHSTASDGQLRPEELVAAAAEAGVELLSITDHDVVDAYAGLAVPAGLSIVPGVELSTRHDGRGVHVVGLDVDLRSDALDAALAAQRRARLERAGRIAEQLRRRGIDDALAGATRHAGGAPPGRPHFAAHLVTIGACRNPRQAFHKYLGRGGGIIDTWPPIAEVVTWIRDAGGHAVLAHPAKYGLTRQRLQRLVEAFRGAGGTAIEVVSGAQDPDLTHRLATLATQHHLAASTGSDFHRPDEPWARIGGQRALPASCRPVWELWS